MEDAATAEICRAQVWQWLKFGVKLYDGRPVTETLVRGFLADQAEETRRKIGSERFKEGQYELAADLLQSLLIGSEFPEFLTLAAYDHLA
jgi:malate synthase